MSINVTRYSTSSYSLRCIHAVSAKLFSQLMRQKILQRHLMEKLRFDHMNNPLPPPQCSISSRLQNDYPFMCSASASYKCNAPGHCWAKFYNAEPTLNRRLKSVGASNQTLSCCSLLIMNERLCVSALGK